MAYFDLVRTIGGFGPVLLLGQIDGWILFLNDQGLWRTDGTSSGTQLVTDAIATDPINGRGRLIGTSLEGAILFSVDELWRTDGTSAGTSLVADINPQGGSEPTPVGRLSDGTVLFAANDSIHGDELWRTDGTAAGTRLVADLVPGSRWSSPQPGFTLSDGGVLFASAAWDFGLWRTDGTASGTTRIDSVLYPELFGELPEGGVLLSAMDDEYGVELWYTDGSPAGTRLVADIWPGPSSSWPHFVGRLPNGEMILGAQQKGLDLSLWRSDGTREGTRLIVDISQDSFERLEGLGNLPSGRVLFYRKKEFGLADPQIWVTDGTSSGTVTVGTVTGWLPFLEPLFIIGSTAYFSEFEASTRVWRTNGSESDFQLISTNLDRIRLLAVDGHRALVLGSTEEDGLGLWWYEMPMWWARRGAIRSRARPG